MPFEYYVILLSVRALSVSSIIHNKASHADNLLRIGGKNKDLFESARHRTYMGFLPACLHMWLNNRVRVCMCKSSNMNAGVESVFHFTIWPDCRWCLHLAEENESFTHPSYSILISGLILCPGPQPSMQHYALCAKPRRDGSGGRRESRTDDKYNYYELLLSRNTAPGATQ